MASYSAVPNPAISDRNHTHSPGPSLSHFHDGRRDSSESLASSSRRDSRAPIIQHSPPAHTTTTHTRGPRPLSLLHRDSSSTLYSPPEWGGQIPADKTGVPPGPGPYHPHGSRESTLSLTIPPGQLYPANFDATVTLETGWKKFRRMKGLAPGWGKSVYNVVVSSWVNILVVILPFSWIAHFKHWSMTYSLFFSILGLVPLAQTFEFLGEQMALYCGQTLGDLIVITLSNSIEVVLAVMLLLNCELRLAQATIAGVVLLHLLLVPGCAFLTGGAKIWYQQLGEHASQLNQSLLAAGFIFMLIPTVFFTAIGNNSHLLDVNGVAGNATEAAGHAKRVWNTMDLTGYDAVSDETRGVLLQISRGIAVIMLIVYIASRIYLHNPPGDKPTRRAALAALSPKEREDVLENSKPLVNPGVCAVFLCVTAMVMTLTTEWLVDSIPEYYEQGWITEEWLGLILLPLTSFAADAMIVTVYFIKTLFRRNPPLPEGIAHGRSIDLSVQFLMFWMPFIVLVAWVLGKPFSLLFDIFELACIFGGCFLVNYITQDAKTNWAEGLVMIMTYVVIALTAWYYPSQRAHSEMMACTTTVLGALMGEEVNHGV